MYNNLKNVFQVILEKLLQEVAINGGANGQLEDGGNDNVMVQSKRNEEVLDNAITSDHNQPPNLLKQPRMLRYVIFEKTGW